MRNIERDIRDTIEGMVAPIRDASVSYKDIDGGRTRAVIAIGARRKAINFGKHARKGVTSALKRIEIDTRQALRELGAIDCPRASGIPPEKKTSRTNVEHHKLIASVFSQQSSQPAYVAPPSPPEEPVPMPAPNTHNPSLTLVKPTEPEREKRVQLTHDQVLDIAMLLQQNGRVEALDDGSEVYAYATGWSDDRIREKIGVAATRVNEKIAEIRKKRFGLTVAEHEREKRRADRGTASDIAELRAENAELRARIEKLEAFVRQFE